ncbi:hypothetical protein [Halobacteriovorax sp. YZS-1-1]|uniref:hypothetical protein n=1 Tax=unclassified Halobacteriovorax TaxID=2639665 RepID=UPI00399B5C01
MHKTFIMFFVFITLVSCNEAENANSKLLINSSRKTYSLSKTDQDFLNLFTVEEDDTYYYTDQFKFISLNEDVKEETVKCQVFYSAGFDNYTELVESIYDKSFFDITLIYSLNYYKHAVKDVRNECIEKLQNFKDATLALSNIEKDRVLAHETLSLIDSSESIHVINSNIEKIESIEVKEALTLYTLGVDQDIDISEDDLNKLRNIVTLKTSTLAYKTLVNHTKANYKETCSYNSRILRDYKCRLKYHQLTYDYLKSKNK